MQKVIIAYRKIWRQVNIDNNLRALGKHQMMYNCKCNYETLVVGWREPNETTFECIGLAPAKKVEDVNAEVVRITLQLKQEGYECAFVGTHIEAFKKKENKKKANSKK